MGPVAIPARLWIARRNAPNAGLMRRGRDSAGPEAPRGLRPSPEPMKLLKVTSYYDTHRGGAEIVAGVVARGLAARGMQVAWAAAAVTPAPAAAPDLAMTPFRASNLLERRLGLPFPLPSPGALAQLARAVAGADAVMLHDSLCPPSLAAFALAKLHRKPVLAVQHIGTIAYRNPLLATAFALADRLLARPLLARAEQVVFISQTTRAHFASLRFKAAPELVFNGVDTETFRPLAQGRDREGLRAELGLEPNRPTALFVGRFVEKKGLEHLRRVAALRPEVAFVFAGWGGIDPLGWGLANVSVRAGLSGAGLARLYQAADVLVLPSQGEGFPLVVQEALACGLPVICGAETVEADPEAAPWLSGVAVAGDDTLVAQALSRALTAALTAPGDRMARADFAQTRYAWASAVERYAALLARIAPPPAPSPTPAARSPEALDTAGRPA